MVLIVQNSLPLREVSTATASNSFFCQIGATRGSAVRVIAVKALGTPNA